MLTENPATAEQVTRTCGTRSYTEPGVCGPGWATKCRWLNEWVKIPRSQLVNFTVLDCLIKEGRTATNICEHPNPACYLSPAFSNRHLICRTYLLMLLDYIRATTISSTISKNRSRGTKTHRLCPHVLS